MERINLSSRTLLIVAFVALSVTWPSSIDNRTWADADSGHISAQTTTAALDTSLRMCPVYGYFPRK